MTNEAALGVPQRKRLRRAWLKGFALGLAVFLAGFILRGCLGNLHAGHETAPAAGAAERKVKFWTCSMHPQIHASGPGQCPICGMDLIPVYESGGDVALGPDELQLSPSAMKRAEIQTAPVERRWVTRDVRMVGKVTYDETRMAYLTAWVPGRIDRLYADYTGIAVRKGDHLASLYSPDLIASQEELIQSVGVVRKLAEGNSEDALRRARRTLEASREKLRLLGLTTNQVAEIEQSGKPSDHLTIYAPISGIVVKKEALEGLYVTTGTRIYTLADLSRVWVKLDAYESDLAWLRYGQDVTFEAESWPGEVFHGRVAFIDPVLDDVTRTIKVRVNADNADGRLKPGMFVRAVAHAELAEGGKVRSTDLAGKWICPMHPEAIGDTPGACPICGMALVPAASLGYAPPAVAAVPPLTIPATAPLLTGKRAVVYVAVPGHEGRFEGREVVLGPRAGDDYLVNSGLEEGEVVVASGQFKIDSALQIEAKPSMMNPPAEAPPGTAAATAPVPAEPFAAPPPAFSNAFAHVAGAYFDVAAALAADDPDAAAKAAERLSAAVKNTPMAGLVPAAMSLWMARGRAAGEEADAVAKSTGLAAQRERFRPLSDAIGELVRGFGTGGVAAARVFCPMAFGGQGAYWLQRGDAVHNPYFGSAMPACGEVAERYAPEATPPGGEAP